MSKKIEWIPEKEAAEMVRRKPETLRKLCKSGKLEVAYSAINGRGFQYNLRDLERVLVVHSTLQ